ncbi:MAG: murein L,D-transpeptidase [Undibacterium sp.]|nr:murein L,D-transpeptidase [Opitutaceae bacterium]
MKSPMRAFRRVTGPLLLSVAAGLLRESAAEPVIEFKLPPAPVLAPAEPEAPSVESPAELVERAAAPAKAYPPQPVTNWLEAQIELARRGFSSGAIDGVGGAQTAAALKAFQENEGLIPTGALDKPTRAKLQLTAPALAETNLTPGDIARLQPLSDTWLGKSMQTALEFETVLELVAERAHASPALIKRLNLAVDWEQPPVVGTVLMVPAVGRLELKGEAARLHVRLAEHVLQVRDAEDRVIAHFPVSIAKKVEKRPLGELHVIAAISKPDYTFDPEVFPESEEARELGRKLILPPGPNNPVGVAWIGLDRPGYGIHGTPKPEQVGRTESHGCFRLANWDAQTLVKLVWVGLPVVVDP